MERWLGPGPFGRSHSVVRPSGALDELTLKAVAKI